MHRKSLLLVVCLAALQAVAAPDRAEKLRAELLNPNGERVLVAAHRADWRNYPENSLEGMESAIKMGVDILEIDLQMTADSQLVIMHDARLDRTTTGKGLVAEWSLDSIRTLYLRNGHGEPSRYRVPTLREVLEQCKGRVLINLDKADRYFPLVMPLLEETGTTGQIIMKGRKTAEEVRTFYGTYLDEVIYMPVVNLNKASDLKKIEAFQESLQPVAYEFCFKKTPEFAREASAQVQGTALVWVNTLWASQCAGYDDDSRTNLDESYGFLIDSLHARIIQTDRPQRLIEYLKNRVPENRSYMRDWAQYKRYQAQNDSVHAGLLPQPKVVFMGNSITQHWMEIHPQFFVSNNFAGRGISGQTSAQMLARFLTDVVSLRPKKVVILAGTNDVACNNGYISNEHILENVDAMCTIAKSHHIRPIICSIPPCNKIYWRKSIGDQSGRIQAINAMLKAYAQSHHIQYVNYYDALVDEDNGFRSDLSKDGVHPLPEGYDVMEKIILKAIK